MSKLECRPPRVRKGLIIPQFHRGFQRFLGTTKPAVKASALYPAQHRRVRSGVLHSVAASGFLDVERQPAKADHGARAPDRHPVAGAAPARLLEENAREEHTRIIDAATPPA